jgi:pimeloyl-ACP methyl ester carboxylesterase
MTRRGKPIVLSRRSFIIGTTATMLIGPASRETAGAQFSDIAVRFVGTNEPTLIFVHGFVCSLDDWDQQVAALSPRFRCVALDLPGQGHSARPATASIAVMGSAVNQVKERFNAKNAILIGHSMGCRVISEALQQSPTNVVGLVYVDGSLLGGDPEAAVNRAKEAIDRSGMDALTQRLFNDMFLEGSDLKLRDRLVARALSVDAKFREELFLDTIRWDVTKAKDALNAINVPVLVLQATYLNSELKRMPMQPGMTTPWMDAVAKSVPKSEAKVVQGSGHFAMLEAAPQVNDAIAQFATRLS